MNLKDFKDRHIQYDWKTIFVGVQENYFSKDVISDYAIELMEMGEDNSFVNELAWGVSNEELDKVMLEIKTNYFPLFDDECPIFMEENRKLRFVCLSSIKERYKDCSELLNKIAEFYDNHHYPVDMVKFVNYMPQEVPTTKEDMINRFDEFLKSESIRYR